MKQNKKAKICFVIYIAGFFFLNFFCYEVIVKQKIYKRSSIYYLCVFGACRTAVRMVDDHCVQGHLIRRKCNVSKEDALCITCERIAQAESEREERTQAEREKKEQREYDRLIDEVRQQQG